MPILPLLKLAFELNESSKQVMEMVQKELLKRLEKLQQQTTYKSAEYILDRLLLTIPATDEYALYRKSLELVRITGMPKGTCGYSVRVPTRNKKIKGVDADRSLLYVKARKTLSRIRPAIKVLVDGSPWTVDTLPFWPAKKEAKVIVRKVRSQEVKKISKKLKRTAKLTWKKELTRAGVKSRAKGAPLKIPKGAKIIPDLAFQAIRLEFGQGGVKPKPHWRPAIRSLVTERLPRMGNGPQFRKVLLAPTSKEWKNWPTRTKSSISDRIAASYIPFMKRLRIRV